jgi:hypothetical protein
MKDCNTQASGMSGDARKQFPDIRRGPSPAYFL